MVGPGISASEQGQLQEQQSSQSSADTPTPVWPERPAARPDAPNVLVWLIDDLGYAQIGAYGGLVATPNIDRVARMGLRYTNYHTTPICSASRAALLTGRNAHTVHVGGHQVAAAPFAGYDLRVPRSAGTLAENLRLAGYATYALGKWDHLPGEDASAAGPFTYWPSGQRFDQFYGFLASDADHFSPVLWQNQQPVPPATDPRYHLSEDLADRAIDYIDSRDAGTTRRPFMLYWATGAVHAPHHAPQAYLDQYKGKFSMGWDAAREEILKRQKAAGLVPQDAKLPPRTDGMLPWDSLSADQQRLYAREMEAFAAQLTHTDEQFGRILARLEERGELDNTIIVITSDNGAGAEGGPHGHYNENAHFNSMEPTFEMALRYFDKWGGPETYPIYPLGWAVAGNTPFRYYKQTAYEGGTRVPLIVSWGRGIPSDGSLRSQYHHVADLTPTILDAAGVKPAPIVNGEPQMPFDGISFANSFAAPQSRGPRRVQYYNLYGNRAIWADGWKAVNSRRVRTQERSYDAQGRASTGGWELYQVDRDFNELNDLAASNPQKLDEMLETFDREAQRFDVYPLITAGEARKAMAERAERRYQARDMEWTYSGPISRIPSPNAPPIHLRSFTLDATFQFASGDHGALMAYGGQTGGMALYIRDGKPVFVWRDLDLTRDLVRIVGKPLAEGTTTVSIELDRSEGGANIQMRTGTTVLGTAFIPSPLPRDVLSLSEGFDIGSDVGTPVSPDYAVPFIYSGDIKQVRATIR